MKLAYVIYLGISKGRTFIKYIMIDLLGSNSIPVLMLDILPECQKKFNTCKKVNTTYSWLIIQNQRFKYKAMICT